MKKQLLKIEKLMLNKKTIAQFDKNEINRIIGGQSGSDHGCTFGSCYEWCLPNGPDIKF